MAKLGKPVAAIMIMAAIIAVLFVLCTPRTTSNKSEVRGTAGVRRLPSSRSDTIRVLVLDFDPTIPDSGSRRAHSAFGWNDPRELARAYAADVAEASGGRVRFDVVEWRTLDQFPRKQDGFRYTAIDEVWLVGGPYFGYFEAAMAGPGSFDINGGPFPKVKSQRAFAIMGFNSERGVAEMLHDLCHRVEATMARVYGGWQAESLTTNWARFAANAHQSGGRSGAGTCHVPPNATAEYDYANPRAVESDADDWLGYPTLTGATRPVTRETWGGPDYHRSYMRWWLTRLPRAVGTNADGRLNDWWAYVVHFNDMVIRGQPRL